jgi:hypothetical protein
LETTAQSHGLKVNNDVDERHDFDKAALAAAKKLRKGYDQHGSWYNAIAAYNAGDGRVRQFRTKNRPLPSETDRYVPGVMDHRNAMLGYPSSLTIDTTGYDITAPRSLMGPHIPKEYKKKPKALDGGATPTAEIEGGEFVYDKQGLTPNSFKMFDSTGKSHHSPYGYLAHGKDHHPTDNSAGIKADGEAYISSKHLAPDGNKASKNNPSVASRMVKYGGKALGKGYENSSDKFGINDWNPGAKRHHIEMMDQIARDAELGKIRKDLKNSTPANMMKQGGIVAGSARLKPNPMTFWNQNSAAYLDEANRETELKQDYKDSINNYTPSFDKGGALRLFNSLSQVEKNKLAQELKRIPKHMKGAYLKKCLGGGKVKSKPKNTKLYSRVKAEAKNKFDVYPSRYANYWLSREYKKRGGTY